jgi:hypothetical protein
VFWWQRLLYTGVGVPVGEVVVLYRQRLTLIAAGAHASARVLFNERSRACEALVRDRHTRSVTALVDSGPSAISRVQPAVPRGRLPLNADGSVRESNA